MKICEVCGSKEDMENNDLETMESVILHVCESCREDRKWHTLEN
jgi:ribosome-binding protein aMBF1 (putative translation factor)